MMSSHIRRHAVHFVLSSAIFAAALTTAPAESLAKRKHVQEAIAAGIIGAAIGAALSHRHKHRKDIYYEGYEPDYEEGGYGEYYGRNFSPAPGVTCIEARRTCYDADGTFSNGWMRRLYGK